MKHIAALAIGAFMLSSSYAQTTVTTTTTKTTKTVRTATAARSAAIGGIIRDGRFHPLPGVETFVYGADSTIIASGYTDDKGVYETNSVAPGKYDLKVMYPNNKTVIIKAVPVKNGVTRVTFNLNPPDSDTTLQYTDVAPRTEPKKKGKLASN